MKRRTTLGFILLGMCLVLIAAICGGATSWDSAAQLATDGAVSAATGDCVQVAGDTMSGGLSMGNNGVSNFAWLVAYNNTLNAAALSAGILSGQENEILTDSTYAFVGGGYNNKITGSSGASIMGGYDNDIGDNAHYSGTLGGYSCDVQAGAEYATVLGGAYNDAQKKFTTVAGRRAHASHAGSFVWADSANSDYASRATNSFNIRAAGGIYYNTTCVASNGAVLIGALSIAPVTNNQVAVTLAGTFSGDGAALSNVLSTFSVTQDYSLVSVVSTGLSLEVPTDLFLVKSFELFVPDTNNTPTAHPINTHVWETSDYTGKPPYHGVSNNAFLVEGLVASNIAAASTNLWLVDGSSFAANNMVTILGLTNEYAQIRTLSGNVATLWRPTVYAHSMSCGVSRVLTGAGFVYEAQDSGNFHFSIDADAAVTANLRAILCGWRD